MRWTNITWMLENSPQEIFTHIGRLIWVYCFFIALVYALVTIGVLSLDFFLIHFFKLILYKHFLTKNYIIIMTMTSWLKLLILYLLQILLFLLCLWLARYCQKVPHIRLSSTVLGSLSTLPVALRSRLIFAWLDFLTFLNFCETSSTLYSLLRSRLQWYVLRRCLYTF